MCQSKGLISTEVQTKKIAVTPQNDKSCNDQGSKGERKEHPGMTELYLVIYLIEQWRYYP